MNQIGVYNPMAAVNRILQAAPPNMGNSATAGFMPSAQDWTSQVNPMGAAPTPRPVTPEAQGGWMGRFTNFLGGMGNKPAQTTKRPGETGNDWASLVVGGAQAVAGTYLGMKQYGLAKKELAESRRQFNANFEMQRSDINRRLEDRQNTRNAENSELHMSTTDYMKKYGV